jgi:paraquat-inducible protein B
LRVGLFALLGLALLAAALVVVFGMGFFSASERAVMNFRGSVYGLQLGSPVVLRGVRVGTVRAIGLATAGGQFAVPVEAELDSAQLQALATGAPDALAALVQQGLVAQLATQSLLTGQLYVDLDLHGPGSAPTRDAAGRLQIPTVLTRFQSLQEQLDQVDLNRLAQDLGATLAAARSLVGGPEIKQTLTELAQASAALARLAATLDRRIPALSDAAQGTLRQARDASQRLGGAADQVGGAAARVESAAAQAETLLQKGSPVLASVQQAADELGRSAAALRTVTSDDSATAQSVQRAMGDVSRAARSVRELADLIEQQPQSLIRGREGPP